MAPMPETKDVHTGLEETCKIVQDNAATILKHNKEEICQSILAGEVEATVSKKQWFVETVALVESAQHTDDMTWEPDACLMASGFALVNIVLFGLGLAGLRVAANAKMARALLEAMGQETVRGMHAGLHNMYIAYKTGNAAGAAKELFGLLGQLYRAGGLSAVVKVVIAEMRWFDWLYTGMLALAQVVAWVATDGVAFMAEAMLVIPLNCDSLASR